MANAKELFGFLSVIVSVSAYFDSNRPFEALHSVNNVNYSGRSLGSTFFWSSFICIM